MYVDVYGSDAQHLCWSHLIRNVKSLLCVCVYVCVSHPYKNYLFNDSLKFNFSAVGAVQNVFILMSLCSF